MDEDSLSRDCEPFFQSDGEEEEEESTDGRPRPPQGHTHPHQTTRLTPPAVCLSSGSLSEEAPPPSRGLAVGMASRKAPPLALARSLPVSVPVWGCKGGRAPPGHSGSGERVRSLGTPLLQPVSMTWLDTVGQS